MLYLPTRLTSSLRDAYAILVKGFGKTGSSTSPGPGATVAGLKAASFAQKLWRFCSDPRVKGPDLIDPMHQAIRHELAHHPGILLAVHDWSTLSFGGHPSKIDRATLTHAHDVGYDLATVLMVRGDDGSPVAPAVVSLTTAEAVFSTRDDAPIAEAPHIDQIRDAMAEVRDLSPDSGVVHVIDREADSVDHWRQWARDGHLALVRADDRKVLHEGRETSLIGVADRLRDGRAWAEAGPVLYKGRPARLFVAEAEVVLHRPGKRNLPGGKRREIPGPPLPLRLVVAEVRDSEGRALARWLLLTNVPGDMAGAATVARWYYFRWRIESMHKLLKSAGMQLEGWLQRDGQRLFRKLLIAMGACVAIWELERREDASSCEFKALLMELSGRQTKRARAITTSGLLAGLWVLQKAVDILARHGPDQLIAMLENHLPLFALFKEILVSL
jgi:hypothetical protein